MNKQQTKLTKEYMATVKQAHDDCLNLKITIREFDEAIAKAQHIYKTEWRRSLQHIDS